MKFATLSALFAVAMISEGQAIKLGQNAMIRDQLRQRLQIQAVPTGDLSLPIYQNVNNAIAQTNLADSSIIAANGNLTQANTLIAQSDSQLSNGWGQVGSADQALDRGMDAQKLIAPSITGAQTSLSQAQKSLDPISGQVSDESADIANQLKSVNDASNQAVALDDRCDPNDAQYSANQAECTQAKIASLNNQVIASANSASAALGKYI